MTVLDLFLAVYAIFATFWAVAHMLDARMYRLSRDRWREAFWSIGPALGAPPEGVENIDD